MNRIKLLLFVHITFVSVWSILVACQTPTKEKDHKVIEKAGDFSIQDNIQAKQQQMNDSLELEQLDLEDIQANMNEVLELIKQKKPVKIVCYGNSITYGFRVGYASAVANPYPQILEAKLKKQFQNTQVEVINEGHNGWRSDQGLANVRNLVLRENPDVVILMFGINDAYSSFSPTYYIRQMTKIVEMIQTVEAKIILMNPTPILTQFNDKVLAYSPLLAQLAEDKKIAFFNLYQKIIQKKSESILNWNQILPDDVHFADDQYAWIAEALFLFLNE